MVQRHDPDTATLERPREEAYPMPDAPVAVDKSARRAQGVRDLLGGAVLIGIGFAMGGSVFTGDPTILDWFFDGLGSFWALKGIYLLVT